MNPFTAALAAGYTGVQVLEYLARSNPKFAKIVERSLKSGHSLEQVAEYLSKEFEGLADTKAKRKLEAEVVGKPTAHQKSLARELRTKREDRLLKTLGATGLALGGAAAARAALGSRAASGLPQIAMQNPPGSMPLPGAGGMPMGGGPGPMPPTPNAGPTNGILQAYMNHIMQGGKADLSNFLKTSMGVMAGQGMQQPAPAPAPPVDVTAETQITTPGQPQAPAMQPEQPESGLNKAALQPEEAERVIVGMGIKDRIDALLNAGNDPELAGKIAELQLSPNQKVLAKEQGIDIPSLVRAYAAGRQQAPKKTEEITTPSKSDNPEKWKYKTERFNNNKKEYKPFGKSGNYNTYIKDIGDGLTEVVAEDENGNVVGSVTFGKNENGKLEAAVEVSPSNRRQGLASDIYKKIEKYTGERLTPGANHSPYAKAMWENPNRQFGEPEQAPSASQMPQNEPQQQLQPQIEPQIEESEEPLQTGNIATLPDGRVGEIEKIEGNKVHLNVDGEKKIAPLDHILRPSKAAIGYTEPEIDAIIERIPESDRSTAFYMFQPLGNGMVYVELTSNADHGYIYENVPDELTNRILSASTAPKTSGENLFGVYSQEVADSRGSPFTELRQNPERYPFRKVSKGYDLLQLFKSQSTELNKKREKEKRALLPKKEKKKKAKK